VSYPNDERPAPPPSPAVPEVVYRGSRSLCHEFSLLLEAQAIDHELLPSGGAWELTVMPGLAARAHEEITRYSAERGAPPPVPREPEEPFTGAAIGSVGYTVILLATAYFAGIHLFGADWLSLGALRAGSLREWWRAFTALTLHLDQEHLLGNLLFGVVAGAAAGRLLGPGVAWASILGAAVLANCVEIGVAPAGHLAVGASTAVFAALGLLAGLAWRRRLSLRERRWYRWAPLIAGICLLTFLGSGSGSGGTAATAHVDVLGHALGFLFGTGVGWLYARLDIPRDHGRRLQIAAGAGAVLMVCAAWLVALGRAG
jgi:membrane associated rhomboid family serine protease